MAGTLFTPTQPVVSISSRDRATPVINGINDRIQQNNAESIPLVSGVAFPVYETAIFTSGIFIGILITLSMMTIFRR